MSASLKIRWGRLVNELTYLHEENEFLQDINESVAPEFHEHYQDLCERLEIDLEALNKEHDERVRKMYGAGNQPGKNEAKTLSDLQQQVAHYTKPPILFTDEEAGEITTSEYEKTQDDTELHEVFNKTFRKIAMKLHPDRLPKDLSASEREDAVAKFNSARRALEDKKYFVILTIAKELNIKTPRNYKQQIRWMKKESNRLRAIIRKNQSTYNYLFSECETQEEKDNVIKQFMRHLFGINLS